MYSTKTISSLYKEYVEISMFESGINIIMKQKLLQIFKQQIMHFSRTFKLSLWGLNSRTWTLQPFSFTKMTFNEAHSTGLSVTFLRRFFTVLTSSLREAFDLFINIVQLVITMYAHSIQINIVCPVKLESWMIWTFEFKNYIKKPSQGGETNFRYS